MNPTPRPPGPLPVDYAAEGLALARAAHAETGAALRQALLGLRHYVEGRVAHLDPQAPHAAKTFAALQTLHAVGPAVAAFYESAAQLEAAALKGGYAAGHQTGRAGRAFPVPPLVARIRALPAFRNTAWLLDRSPEDVRAYWARVDAASQPLAPAQP